MTDARLSRVDALKRLHFCLEFGVVEYHPHLLQRCRERGIAMQLVQLALRKGRILREAEFDLRFREWRYRVEWSGPDDPPLVLVIAFPEEEATLVITAILPGREFLAESREAKR